MCNSRPMARTTKRRRCGVVASRAEPANGLQLRINADGKGADRTETYNGVREVIGLHNAGTIGHHASPSVGPNKVRRAANNGGVRRSRGNAGEHRKASRTQASGQMTVLIDVARAVGSDPSPGQDSCKRDRAAFTDAYNLARTKEQISRFPRALQVDLWNWLSEQLEASDPHFLTDLQIAELVGGKVLAQEAG
jgi:hypothetical protein